MNVNAPQNNSPQRQYLRLRPQVQQRRATLPSLVFSPEEANSITDLWQHSEEGDDIDRHSAGSAPSPIIGLALTKEDSLLKRRSRSADELRRLMREQQQQEQHLNGVDQQLHPHLQQQRRRSAEIRYWRSSYAVPSNELGNDYPRRQDADEEENPNDEITRMYADATASPEVIAQPLHHELDENDDVDGADGRAADPLVIPADHEDDRDDERPSTVTFAKDYHNQHHRRSPDSGVAASNEDLETRMSRVERRVFNLEESVHKLNGRSNRQTIILEGTALAQTPPPTGRRSARDTSRSPLPESMRMSPSSRHGHLPSPDSSADELNHPPPQQHHSPHPYSRSRGGVATPNSGLKIDAYSDSGASESLPPASIYPHLTPLYKALRYERAARKQLESELVRLQHEMFDMQMTIKRLNSEHCAATSAAPTTAATGAEAVQSRFSSQETEDGADDDDDDDANDRDMFQTPKEEADTPRLGFSFPGMEANANSGAIGVATTTGGRTAMAAEDEMF